MHSHNASYAEMYSDADHRDWCEAETPEECEGDCGV